MIKRTIKTMAIFGATIIVLLLATATNAVGTETETTDATADKESLTTETPPATYAATREWTDEEKNMILKIAMSEAEGETTEGKALVMLTVLNRVQSPSFPNTIYGVIFQKNQFSPVKSGGRYWTTTPNADCHEALNMILNGWDESKGALYFESCTGESWHSRNLEFLFKVGRHKFYR